MISIAQVLSEVKISGFCQKINLQSLKNVKLKIKRDLPVRKVWLGFYEFIGLELRSQVRAHVVHEDHTSKTISDHISQSWAGKPI